MHGYAGKFRITDDHRAWQSAMNLTVMLKELDQPNSHVQFKDVEK